MLDSKTFVSSDMSAKVSQGVTTVVTGNCGISLAPLTLTRAPPPPLDLIGDERDYCFGRFADYRLRGVQCALHPALYERSLRGSLLARRVRTLLATLRLVRMRPGLSAAPLGTKYSSVFSYLLFGVLLRAVPKGTDMIFAPQAGKLIS